jgi:diaminopropionate ammonia-lyase
VIVVEAEAAACLYKGAALGTGELQIVDGDMVTIMAGLACGEPNTISWDILKNHVDSFVAAPDWVAARGMRMLAAPVKGDSPVTSGESGAAPFGALSCIMCMDEYKELREHLGLDESSKVLLFSTEGDTDPERYESIVWGGNSR